MTPLYHTGFYLGRLTKAIGYSPELTQKLRKLSRKIAIPTIDAWKNGEPVLIETNEEAMLRYPLVESQSFAANYQAFAAIPLKLDEKVIGVLNFSFVQPLHFSKEDIIFMNILANHCSIGFARSVAQKRDSV